MTNIFGIDTKALEAELAKFTAGQQQVITLLKEQNQLLTLALEKNKIK